jgi:hypothetical protein
LFGWKVRVLTSGLRLRDWRDAARPRDVDR